MGLMDFIKGELIEIIEWTDDSRDTLSYRFPDDDKEIKQRRAAHRPRVADGSVRLSRAVRRHLRSGQAHADDRQHPGPHDAQGWKYGFETPFKADVYFVITRLFAGNKWGTSNPVMMRDAGLRDRAAARVRHLRLPHRRAAAVPEGGRRHRPAFPARRIRRRDALAHRQRLQRRAGEQQSAGARRRHTLHASSGTRCCR